MPENSQVTPEVIQQFQQAQQAFNRGELAAAEKGYMAILRAMPGNVDVLLAVAQLRQAQGLPRKNLEICEAILRAAVPDGVKKRALYFKSLALENLQQLDQSIEIMQQARELDESDVGVLSGLAGQLEKQGSLDQARQLLKKVKSMNPSAASMIIVDARCQRRMGQEEQAISQLQDLLQHNPSVARHACYELGRCYDQAGEYELAWQAFCRANEAALQASGARTGNENFFIRYLKIQLENWSESVARQTESSDQEGLSPVQLFGFPRTGSTMVEQLLDAHSRVASLEERPLVHAGLTALDEKERGGYPNTIPQWNRGAFNRFRSGYLSGAEQYLLEPLQQEQYLVDKSPLNVANVFMLKKAFPKSAFVFLMRHPMAVCLSNFQQDFALSEPLANTLRMEDIIQLFDLCMKCFEQAADWAELDYLDLRYENLVADFDQQAGNLLEYIGLDWEDQVRDFHEHAATKTNIGTASYHQVTRKLYDSSVDKWRKYEGHLAPWAEALRPWCERFGYSL